MKRSTRRELARKTLEIVDRGSYEIDGRTVSIASALQRCVAGTVSYPPDQPIDVVQGDLCATEIEVTEETTLSACRRLVAAGHDAVALNFASAKNPGGGFLNGAQAQEESLARSSGLYASIRTSPMYAYHRARSDALYSDYAIYSPGVPVFRDDDGALLAEPYRCAMITSPAVNAGVVLQRDPDRGPAIAVAMRQRVIRVLAIGRHHGHHAIVLGAWGCGVFRNDPCQVAGLFREALGGPFWGAYRRVTFAVHSRHRRFIDAFFGEFPAAGAAR
jgi:uncharacterized protein (TIGR02452 family)